MHDGQDGSASAIRGRGTVGIRTLASSSQRARHSNRSQPER
nr:hypothetical protein [Kibdelosporangium sp. MJ126-NF4]